MKQIEKGLEAYFAESPQAQSDASALLRPTNTTAAGAPQVNQFMIPFAKVNSVATNGPADVAGLLAGDRVQKFGDADCVNHENLSKVARIVAQNQGVSCVTFKSN